MIRVTPGGTFTPARNMTSKEALLLSKIHKDTLYAMIINNSCRQQFKFIIFPEIETGLVSLVKNNNNFVRNWLPIEMCVYLDLGYRSVIFVILKVKEKQ